MVYITYPRCPKIYFLVAKLEFSPYVVCIAQRAYHAHEAGLGVDLGFRLLVNLIYAALVFPPTSNCTMRQHIMVAVLRLALRRLSRRKQKQRTAPPTLVRLETRRSSCRQTPLAVPSPSDLVGLGSSCSSTCDRSSPEKCRFG